MSSKIGLSTNTPCWFGSTEPSKLNALPTTPGSVQSAISPVGGGVPQFTKSPWFPPTTSSTEPKSSAVKMQAFR